MKKTLSIVLAAILLICMVPAFTIFAEEEFDFTTIDTPEEFDAFTKAVNAGTYVPTEPVKFTANLDMKDITDFEPIKELRVDLDFRNYTIYNLVVTTDGHPAGAANCDAALFACKVFGSTIKNLRLYNCHLIANNVNRAGLVAGDFNRGGFDNIEIENCTIDATFYPDATGKYAAAVVAAYNYGAIEINNIKVKNVLIQSENGLTASSVLGCIYPTNAIVLLNRAEVESVYFGSLPVEKMLAQGNADVNYLADLYVADENNILINNDTVATGYINGAATLPDRPYVDPDLTTAPVTTTTPTTNPPTTNAPTTNPPTTKAPTTNAPTTTAPEKEGGCKGFAAASAAIISLLTAAGSVLFLKKKED